MKLGEKIAVCRKKAGLSQEALAEKLSEAGSAVSRQTVSRWETGEVLPDVEKIVLLSRLFKVTTDELLLDNVPSGEVQPGVLSDSDVSEKKKQLSEPVLRRRQGIRIAAGAFLLAAGIALFVFSLVWASVWAGKTTWWYTSYGAFGTGLLRTGDIWIFISGILLFAGGIAVFVREYLKKD